MQERTFRLADRFLPATLGNPLEVQRYRSAVIQSWLGVFFTVTFGALYAWLGSPWSGGAILLITAALLLTPFAIRKGASPTNIGNVVIAMTWVTTAMVTARSGGFASPALVWNFLFPLCTYSACGRRSAVVWSCLSGLQIGGFYVADVLGVPFASDFSPQVLSMLRISGYFGVVMALAAVLVVVDSGRQAAMKAQEQANRLLERERLVADIHDGIGSQLGVLVALAGKGNVAPTQLAADLSACLDDLRLIVDSLDEQQCSLEYALGELRARVQPRCEALGVSLSWNVAVQGQREWSSVAALQVLRSAQELLANSLRHGRPQHIRLCLADCPEAQGLLRLSVEDDGDGVALEALRKARRGLTSLARRAERLGGRFTLEDRNPGLRAVLDFPG